MEIFHKIAFAVLTISFFTFVALFGRLPALRKTPIGYLQRLLCLYIPSHLRRIDANLTGGILTFRTQRFVHYVFYEKNPIILILFLALLTLSSLLFLSTATPFLSLPALLPIPPLLLAPYLLTYLTASSRAHLITPASHPARMRDYPYDHTLFHPSAPHCRSCERPKPPRSKHCGMCGTCVAKADHHCPWFDNCVGRGNYAYFLGVLLSVGVLEVYGAWLAWGILAPGMPGWTAERVFSGEMVRDLRGMLGAAVDKGGLGIAGVGALATATAPLPLGLLAYHVYLVWAGMTTNEAAKWGEWKEDVADGCVFRASRGELREYLLKRKREGRGGVMFAWDEGWNPALHGLEEGEDGEEVVVPWPVQSDQVLVVTNDGQPPTGQETLWTRVRSMKEVDNIYDLGGWRNLMEVLKER